mmetsp:Transcript_22080/g.33498  ORF Transcript_22080/g.33498 Transcript_22080/m.33498 type:complete len:112 (-) Transcript_22080:306-641(-)
MLTTLWSNELTLTLLINSSHGETKCSLSLISQLKSFTVRSKTNYDLFRLRCYFVPDVHSSKSSRNLLHGTMLYNEFRAFMADLEREGRRLFNYHIFGVQSKLKAGESSEWP